MTKVIYGNFTFNSKAVVWKEKNVTIIPNIQSRQYHGGYNCKFVRKSKDLDVEGRDRPSIIATLLPITEDDFQWDMSFLGYHWMNTINESIDGKQHMHYSTAAYYDELFGIKSRMEGLNMGRLTFFDMDSRMNIVAFQGLQFNFNVATQKYNKVIECKGHRKRNGSGVGAAKVWNGNMKYFEKQNWSEYELE